MTTSAEIREQQKRDMGIDQSGAKKTTKILFLALTDNTGNIDRLYGPAQAPRRATILSTLFGKKIAKSNPRVGWHRFRRTMLGLFGVPRGCKAREDSALMQLAIKEKD